MASVRKYGFSDLVQDVGRSMRELELDKRLYRMALNGQFRKENTVNLSSGVINTTTICGQSRPLDITGTLKPLTIFFIQVTKIEKGLFKDASEELLYKRYIIEEDGQMRIEDNDRKVVRDKAPEEEFDVVITKAHESALDYHNSL